MSDFRARLQPKSLTDASDVLGPRDEGNILLPLYSTNGVLFPFRPAVSVSYTADYTTPEYIHSNYTFNTYKKSSVSGITIKTEFTSQTNDEALYTLAALHFFRTCTKMYFGVNPYRKAGTPPPVLYFSYLGDYQFNRVPVIIRKFGYDFPTGEDYVCLEANNDIIRSSFIDVNFPVNSGTDAITANGPGTSTNKGTIYLPAIMTFTIDLDTQYIPIKVRNEFNLDEYRTGKLLSKGYL